MHILFLTIAYPLSGSNIYTDLVEELSNQGHFVTVCVPYENKNFGPILVSHRRNTCIFLIPTGKIMQTSPFKKGINTLLLEYRFLKAFSQLKFESIDVLLYSTPPITFQKVIVWLKRKYNCICYLMLKDIFPQNAVDLGLLKDNSTLYKYFRHKEKKLYEYSDIIGCLSPGNVNYLLKNNHDLLTLQKQINITPNCVSLNNNEYSLESTIVLKKYNIHKDSIKIIYGGNIGRPQGIDFIIKCIQAVKKHKTLFLTIVGSGTEFHKLKKSITGDATNVKFLDYLPTNTYRELLECMDIGLVFLDNRFTIPNFPSRILDYMNYSKPIIACTDIACDVKQEICDKGAGFWCRSDDINGFEKILETLITNRTMLINMGKESKKLFIEKYSAQTVVANMLREIEYFKSKTLK